MGKLSGTAKWTCRSAAVNTCVHSSHFNLWFYMHLIIFQTQKNLMVDFYCAHKSLAIKNVLLKYFIMC